MKKAKYVFTITLMVFSYSLYASGPKPKARCLKPMKTVNVKFREPSDIAFDPTSDNFFLPVDKSSVIQMSAEGKEVARSKFRGYDLEAVCVVENNLYVVEETFRQVHVFNKSTLERMETFTTDYSGAANKGFEAITYLPDQNQFLVASEKSPQTFFTLNKQFQRTGQFSLNGINEVSAVTWFENSLWVLSDEQMTVFKVNFDTKKIIQSWKIAVINPEGICFDGKGNMYIVSDDMKKLFIYKQPDL